MLCKGVDGISYGQSIALHCSAKYSRHGNDFMVAQQHYYKAFLFSQMWAEQDAG